MESIDNLTYLYLVHSVIAVLYIEAICKCEQTASNLHNIILHRKLLEKQQFSNIHVQQALATGNTTTLILVS